MSVEQMRAVLMKQYGGAIKWKRRVSGMHESQVIAVYYRLLGAGKLK